MAIRYNGNIMGRERTRTNLASLKFKFDKATAWRYSCMSINKKTQKTKNILGYIN